MNQKAAPSLGLAGRTAKAFIHSPLTPLLLLICLAVGFLGLLFTPRQEDPQISVPMVDIFVRYPGASANQVANLVADPLERLMSEIPGVEHVYSSSERDQAMVTVQFLVGEAMSPSLVKLYDKLQSNMDRIPPGVSTPLVKPKGVDDVPVVTFTLWSPDVDDATLNLIALDVLQNVKEVPNTAQGFVVSGRNEQARVEVMPEKLAGYDITLQQIAQAVGSTNSERNVGQVEGWNQSLKLYTGAFLQSAEDIESLVVGVHDGRPVYVRDVAQVTLGPGETQRMVRYYTGTAAPVGVHSDGASAVTLAIAKKEGSNGVTVAKAVLDKVQYLKGRVIPDNVEISITRNYGETARDKVDELILKLFIATGAVAILILFPLGMRAAGVVLVVIPVVILVTVFSAWLLGYTIDRVSLFALIFSIGVLVDDAIVVVENIYRRWLLKGDTDTETSVDAVREVGNPTILATFTVIAALLPMGFVSGMMGPYMEPIPALGSVAMLFSLFAAFIFTPWLAMRLKPSLEQLHRQEEKEHRTSERLDGFYRGLLLPLIQNRSRGRLLLIGIVAVFFACCTLFYSKSVRVKMLPLDNKPEFNVVVNMPAGTALPVTANLVSSFAEQLRKLPEVTSVQTYVGTASPFNFNGLVRHYYLRTKPWQADIQVQLVHKGERSRTSHDIAVEARALLTPMARQANARLQVVEMPPGPPVLQSIVAEIYGPDAQTRRTVAADMERIFASAKHIGDVDSYLQTPVESWRFEVDRDKAQAAGVSVEAVNRTLEMAMGGHSLGDIKRQSMLDPTIIVLQLPLEVRTDFARVGQLPVPASDGHVVPLSELGTWRKEPQDSPIYHKDLRAVEYVTGEGVGQLAAPIYGMSEVDAELQDYVTPDGVTMAGHYLSPPADSQHSGFYWGGEWTVTYETFRDMGLAFGVAMILIYMLVVWEFGNFLLPAIVMAPIPLTLIGIIPGHWLFNAEFTATSMIGFIALAGIIVRNSILLVDFTKHEIALGVDVTEALIRACKTRTRPILITALALVAGSSVILFDPIFQGMAISLMFGVLVSTLLTLIVIPLGCYSGRAAFRSVQPVLAGAGTPGAMPAEPGLQGAAPHTGSTGPSTASTVAGYAGLYARALAGDIVKGMWDLLKALFRFFVAALKRRSVPPGNPAPAPQPRVRPAADAAPAPVVPVAPAVPEPVRAAVVEPIPEPMQAVAAAAIPELSAASMSLQAAGVETSVPMSDPGMEMIAGEPRQETSTAAQSGRHRRGIRLKDDLND